MKRVLLVVENREINIDLANFVATKYSSSEVGIEVSNFNRLLGLDGQIQTYDAVIVTSFMGCRKEKERDLFIGHHVIKHLLAHNFSGKVIVSVIADAIDGFDFENPHELGALKREKILVTNDRYWNHMLVITDFVLTG